MAARNSAFRVAIGGLSLAVILCLVAAISLLGVPQLRQVVLAPAARNAPPAPVENVLPLSNLPVADPDAPIRVATTGQMEHLLAEPVPAARPVPDHPDDESDFPVLTTLPLSPEVLPEQLATVPSEPSTPEPSSAVTVPAVAILPTHLEQELAQLRGEVNELARAQLETQLAALRDAESLLVHHQASREMEALAREIAELKATVVEQATSAIPFTPESLPNLEPVVQAPSNSKVRVQPNASEPSRFDVDAEGVSIAELVGELAPHAGWNVVTSTRSNAHVTCHWRAVDLAETLTQLLKAHQLQARSDGGLMIVEDLASASTSDDSSLKSSAAAMQQGLESLTPSRPAFDIEITPAHPTRRWTPPAEKEARKLDVNSTWVPEDSKRTTTAPAVRENAPLVTASTATPESPTDAPFFQPELAEKRAIAVVPPEESRSVFSLPVDSDEIVLNAPQDVVSHTTPPQGMGEDTVRLGTPSRPVPTIPKIASAETSVPAEPLIEPRQLPVVLNAPSKELSVTQQAVDSVDTLASPANPLVAIQATVLQIRHAAGGQRGLYRRGFPVTRSGAGDCHECGLKHSAEEIPVGHSVDGWHGLPDGVSVGVSDLAPQLMVQRLQQLGELTMTTTPEIQIQRGQWAEIGLTEQQGFRRYLFKGKQGTEQVGLLEGGLQVALRATRAGDGSMILELKPSSPIERVSSGHTTGGSSIRVPAGASVILGGLYFDLVADAADRGDGWLPHVTGRASNPRNLHEVIVILDARPVQ